MTIAPVEAQSAEAPESFTNNATISVWSAATISAMTRTVAKLEVKLAENDPAGHCAAKQLEEDIDALLISAADSFAFDTSEIFRLQVQAAALHRYSVTRSSSDLRKAYGPSKLVYIHDGIEEDNTELSAAA